MEPIKEAFRVLWNKLKEYIVLNQKEITFKQRLLRFLFVWLFSLFLVSSLLRKKQSKPLAPTPSIRVTWKPFSEFLSLVDANEVKRVWFGEDDIVQFSLSIPPSTEEILVTKRLPSHLMPLANTLKDKKVVFEQVSHDLFPNKPASPTPMWQSALMMLLPMAYISLFGYVIYRVFNAQNDQLNNNSDFGSAHKGKGKRTKFSDVQGVNPARDAVQEVCDVLVHPEKYAQAGAKLPKGLLLVGPPGTGKTMMARAMASEAGLPFFYCNGSEFVEIFSGRGAARVRALFAKASKSAPSIVFVDEIDALGGSRGGSGLHNNEEREQTLNQLLGCMDGFDTNDDKIVVIGATNRFEYLDKALVRPGRFDRIVRVDLPDEQGREAILRVHTAQMQLGSDVDLATVAQVCGSGWSGAELASLANEAAICAVRNNRDVLRMNDFLLAIDRFKSSRSKKQRASAAAASNTPGNLMNFFQRMSQPNLHPQDDENELEVEELD